MSNNIHITTLPQVTDIKAGYFLIVETPAGTNIIDFNDFVLSDNNTTFAPLLSTHTEDILSNKTVIQGLTAGTFPYQFNTVNVSTLSAESIKTKGSTGVTTTVELSTKSGLQTMTINNGIITNIA